MCVWSWTKTEGLALEVAEVRSGIGGGVKLSSYSFWPLQGTNRCALNGPITLGTQTPPQP